VRDTNGKVAVDRGLAETIAKLRAEGRSLRAIARQFNVSHVTIIEFLRRRNEATPQHF
jgi:IS30 family transposase